jgi:hypothetical protein
MDLRGIANQVSNTVNPNIIVLWQASSGFTVGISGKTTPTYAAGVNGPAQVQALDNSDLKQIEGLNITGSIRALYMKGNLAGVIRADNQGGDLITIGSQTNAPPLLVGSWLVVKVLESWPNWTKVVIVKQNPVAQ